MVYNVVSFSGGKDSTAMLLKMIEEKIPVDCVLFCDTGLEFPAMYEHIDKVGRETGIHITRVKSEKSFEHIMFEKQINRKPDSKIAIQYGRDRKGYGWPGPRMRWCTKNLKDEPRARFFNAFKDSYEIREYVGIAADEQYRLERKCNQKANHVHPLVEWGMTEADCLDYCYQKGYDWGGLYEYFKRVSCWCCPLQSLEELRNLRGHFPELWKQLREWDDRNFRQFKPKYSVRELDVRFAFEEECARLGKPVKGRKFMEELRERLEEEGENDEE